MDLLPRPAPAAVLDAGDADCATITQLLKESTRSLPGGAVLEVRSRSTEVWEGIRPWCRLTGNDLIGEVEDAVYGRRLYIRRKG